MHGCFGQGAPRASKYTLLPASLRQNQTAAPHNGQVALGQSGCRPWFDGGVSDADAAAGAATGAGGTGFGAGFGLTTGLGAGLTTGFAAGADANRLPQPELRRTVCART
jgi:hypothetical protein